MGMTLVRANSVPRASLAILIDHYSDLMRKRCQLINVDVDVDVKLGRFVAAFNFRPCDDTLESLLSNLELSHVLK